MMMGPEPPMSGRRKQAARNDDLILQAAREVFVTDPTAPISAVAERAGVGISALYRRYESKELLLGKLCADGQAIYLAEVRRALDDDGDPWEAYVAFLQRIVAADTHSLTIKLAGTFTPTERHFANARRMENLGEALFARTKKSGALRPDVTFLDVSFMLELVAGTRLGDAARTAQLRQRFLAVIIDGLRAGSTGNLPGHPPTSEEQTQRWMPKKT